MVILLTLSQSQVHKYKCIYFTSTTARASSCTLPTLPTLPNLTRPINLWLPQCREDKVIPQQPHLPLFNCYQT